MQGPFAVVNKYLLLLFFVLNIPESKRSCLALASDNFFAIWVEIRYLFELPDTIALEKGVFGLREELLL